MDKLDPVRFRFNPDSGPKFKAKRTTSSSGINIFDTVDSTNNHPLIIEKDPGDDIDKTDFADIDSKEEFGKFDLELLLNETCEADKMLAIINGNNYNVADNKFRNDIFEISRNGIYDEPSHDRVREFNGIISSIDFQNKHAYVMYKPTSMILTSKAISDEYKMKLKNSVDSYVNSLTSDYERAFTDNVAEISGDPDRLITISEMLKNHGDIEANEVKVLEQLYSLDFGKNHGACCYIPMATTQLFAKFMLSEYYQDMCNTSNDLITYGTKSYNFKQSPDPKAEYIDLKLCATADCGEIEISNMFVVSLKRFILKYDNLGPIYLYILDDGRSLMCIKISNYTIEYNKNAFVCIKFNLRIDSKLAKFFKDYETKYIFFNPVKNSECNCYKDRCNKCMVLANKSISDGQKVLTIIKKTKQMTIEKTLCDVLGRDDLIQDRYYEETIRNMASRFFHAEEIAKEKKDKEERLIKQRRSIKSRVIAVLIDLMPTSVLLTLFKYGSRYFMRR